MGLGFSRYVPLFLDMNEENEDECEKSISNAFKDKKKIPLPAQGRPKCIEELKKTLHRLEAGFEPSEFIFGKIGYCQLPGTIG